MTAENLAHNQWKLTLCRIDFSNDLPNVDFHLSVIKLCTTKPLAQQMKALAQGVQQWDLSAFGKGNTVFQVIIPPATKLGGVYWNHPVRLSVPSVCSRARFGKIARLGNMVSGT